MQEKIQPGKWTEERLNALIKEGSSIRSPGERIAFLSSHFLGTPYVESTMIGDMNTPEVFVVDLGGLDCFTFIEYIEAMRRSGSFPEFIENLKIVRYRHGLVAFKNRNHFFTDWKAFNAEFVIDVTPYLVAEKTKVVSKRLNESHDGGAFIPGIGCRLREVAYVQSINVDDTVIENLKTGDYTGIYSKKDGLDVSHVGILIKDRGRVYLRHASSVKKNLKVVDEELRSYLKAAPGIIVMRPR